MPSQEQHVTKVCPECGASMHGLDPHGHRLYHFPGYLEPSRTDATALKRAEQIERGGVTVDEYASSGRG